MPSTKLVKEEHKAARLAFLAEAHREKLDESKQIGNIDQKELAPMPTYHWGCVKKSLGRTDVSEEAIAQIAAAAEQCQLCGRETSRPGSSQPSYVRLTEANKQFLRRNIKAKSVIIDAPNTDGRGPADLYQIFTCRDCAKEVRSGWTLQEGASYAFIQAIPDQNKTLSSSYHTRKRAAFRA